MCIYTDLYIKRSSASNTAANEMVSANVCKQMHRRMRESDINSKNNRNVINVYLYDVYVCHTYVYVCIYVYIYMCAYM